MQKNLNKHHQMKKTIDGKYHSYSKEFVGFCWFKGHKGYLSKNQMKAHECIQKNCHYFQKFDDSLYWTTKVEKKRLKRERKNEKKALEQREMLIIEMARECTNKFNYMDFTSIKQSGSNTITLTYFSKHHINLNDCKTFLNRVWHCEIELRLIDVDKSMEVRFLEQKLRRIRL